MKEPTLTKWKKKKNCNDENNMKRDLTSLASKEIY